MKNHDSKHKKELKKDNLREILEKIDLSDETQVAELISYEGLIHKYFQEKGIKAHQIRKIYDQILKILSRLTDEAKEDKIQAELSMELDIYIAYANKRGLLDNEGMIQEIYTVLKKKIKDKKSLEHFKKIFEAIIAYSKESRR